MISDSKLNRPNYFVRNFKTIFSNVTNIHSSSFLKNLLVFDQHNFCSYDLEGNLMENYQNNLNEIFVKSQIDYNLVYNGILKSSINRTYQYYRSFKK